MDFVEILDWFKKLNTPPRPVTVEVDGSSFAVKADGTLGDAVYKPLPVAPVATPKLELKTLSGLVAAYEANVDDFKAGKKEEYAVQVDSFEQVSLVSLRADEWGRRQVWARAVSAEKNPFPFEEYLDAEKFLILAQASFLPIEGHYTTMLKLCNSLTAETGVHVADDGFSQKITAHAGGVKHGEVTLPPRIRLRPYRTFREVDPVESDFLLRFKAKQGALPTVALIPVDAGRWKTDTAMQVAHWLKGHLPKEATVIA